MKGNSPLFAPKNSIAAGDMLFPSGDRAFFENAAKRLDVDPNGFLDILAHGSQNTIQINVNGKDYEISWRSLAQMIRRNPQYLGKGIRLLSCNTGNNPEGFAQNLANKLGVTVLAPNNIIWAYPNGNMIIAPRASNDKKSVQFWMPHPTIRGEFKTYYPGGNKKWKK